jgi:hypothetical protein
MSNIPPANDARNVWKSQVTEPTTMSLEKVRKKLDRIRMRDRITFVIGVAVMAEFGIVAANSSSLYERIGWGTLVLGILIAIFQRAKLWSKVPAQDAAGSSSIQFYRVALKSFGGSQWKLGQVLILGGSLIVVIPIIFASWTNPPPLKAIAPFCILLATWGVLYIYVRRRQRRWMKRELRFLDEIERGD